MKGKRDNNRKIKKSQRYCFQKVEKLLEIDVLCIIICRSVCLNDNCRNVWKI